MSGHIASACINALLRRCAPLALVMLFAAILPAQDRGNIEIVVRNQAGDSLPFARVRATGNSVNTSTSANARGRVTITVPYGIVKVVVSTLGYESVEKNVPVNAPTVTQEFILRAVARQLGDVQVRATYIGIRGGIADETTRMPLAGVKVTSRLLGINVVTDSNGRFEVPMAKATSAVLQLSKDDYLLRPAQIDVRNDGPTDVMLYMTAGKNVRGEATRLDELDRRVRANTINAFTASGAELQTTKMVSLYDALIASGILMRKNMQMGNVMCLFVNGLPRPGFPINTVYVPDIDFIEVYGYKSEVTQSLMADWPQKIPCEEHDTAMGKNGLRSPCRCIVAIVSVWTRKPSPVANDSVRYELSSR